MEANEKHVCRSKVDRRSLLAKFAAHVGVKPSGSESGSSRVLDTLLDAAVNCATDEDSDKDAELLNIETGGWLPSLRVATKIAELFAPHLQGTLLDDAFMTSLRESLTAKFALLHEVGEAAAPLLPALITRGSNSNFPWGDTLLSVKRLLLPEVSKKRFFEVLKETEGRSSHQRLVLNSVGARRFQAVADREKRCDRYGRHTLFGQLWQKARSWSPEQFRLGKGDFAFSVEFEGEGGEDAGGLYRAAIDMAVMEVQSSSLPLMAPTPNARDNCGDYRDCWIFSPSSLGPESLRMVRFLGCLLGLALRSGSLLPLKWPPHLWRPLVGDSRTLEDVKAIDVHAYHLISSLQEDPSLAACLDWSYPDVLGKPGPLKAGKRGPVRPSEATEFIEALYRSRVEYDAAALEELCAGISLVVPTELLRLWTWQELQHAICGEPYLDLKALRAHTVYTNCHDSDTLVRIFWSALESFSEAEKERFLRFVWGRTRLPLGRHWEQNFQLAAVAADDERLPTSHTCFFQLDLPRYSSEQILAERLRFAMNSCITIDSDGQPRTMTNWEETVFSDDDLVAA
eukprot:TRINITY_DN18080_c3_g1_i1.p1 TRINITY_DN18080_c3_g1~~TRINITY_DN18080_c3_g1_i1.p1  ORF type:complete len:599 (+),score=103.98 TRINITY_DN18080_c3_g1_i1:92-1798(+)